MQHLMQIAFEFDDNKIRKRVEEEGFNKICDDIKNMILERIFESRSYYGPVNPKRDPLSEVSIKIIKEVIDEHKNEIIEKAANSVADSIKKTKAYKDTIKQIGEENEH